MSDQIQPKFVFARYEEDISWLYTNPIIANNSIIYNKGKDIKDVPSSLNIKILNLSNKPEYGREGHTYLHHIINNFNNIDSYTIFSQANPFDHCPNFLDIVNYMIDNNLYRDYQPLTSGWSIMEDVPPVNNLLYDTRENINGHSIYIETVDDSLKPIGYIDHGVIRMINGFKAKHNIRNSQMVLKTIYTQIPLHKPYCGYLKFNYGGIFGVSKQKILSHNTFFYNHLKDYVLHHWTHGFILERLWYTIYT